MPIQHSDRKKSEEDAKEVRLRFEEVCGRNGIKPPALILTTEFESKLIDLINSFERKISGLNLKIRCHQSLDRGE